MDMVLYFSVSEIVKRELIELIFCCRCKRLYGHNVPR